MSRNSFKLIPANTFIWNQKQFTEFLIANQGMSISIDTNSEGVCLQTAGVYDQLQQFRFTDVEIFTNNVIEQHNVYRVNFFQPFHFFRIKHGNYCHLHNWNHRYKFACLYNRPLWHRIGLAAELEKYPDALINLRADPADPDQRQLFELQMLFELVPHSLGSLSKSIVNWPRQIEIKDTYTVGNNTSGHTDQLAHFYQEFLIDIVAETWTHGQTFFPTEKTVRPMLLKKPMIVMGPQNYLDYLHQMGFLTFNEFWDESYDGYAGADRYLAILQLVDQLASMSKDQLEDMYMAMQYQLDHNYNLLISQTYTKSIMPL